MDASKETIARILGPNTATLRSENPLGHPIESIEVQEERAEFLSFARQAAYETAAIVSGIDVPGLDPRRKLGSASIKAINNLSSDDKRKIREVIKKRSRSSIVINFTNIFSAEEIPNEVAAPVALASIHEEETFDPILPDWQDDMLAVHPYLERLYEEVEE